MSQEPTTATGAQCNGCGFAAPAGSDDWDRVNHPPLGRVTRCPECGSTDVHAQG